MPNPHPGKFTSRGLILMSAKNQEIESCILDAGAYRREPSLPQMLM
jgi:hypothetical protein